MPEPETIKLDLPAVVVPEQAHGATFYEAVFWIHEQDEPIFQVTLKGLRGKTAIRVEPMHVGGREVREGEIVETESDWD